jgi:hypothetical protein
VKRRSGLVNIAARLVVAIGLSAIIPQFFVMLMPPARKPDRTQSFIAAVQSFMPVVSQQHRSEDIPKPAVEPALAGFKSLLASGETGPAVERGSSETEPDTVLQEFLRWRQKANPNEAAP